MGKSRKQREQVSKNRRRKKGRSRKILLLSLPFFGISAVIGGILLERQLNPAPTEAPEADKILDVQANMPFQILIPAFMPKQFDRAAVDVKVNQEGPGGEPMVQLTYRTRSGATLFVREWVPVNPDMEVLASSRPILTKWGRGWMLSQGQNLFALWTDVGPLRTSIYTNRLDVLSREEILAMANSLGPASNRQVFTFIVETPQISELPAPLPFEVPVNEEGIQELTLVVTPGGYTPLRFAVKKDVPVRLNFRQLGQVGCGNELVLQTGPEHSAALKLESAFDKKVFDFTPAVPGDFQFFCAHLMYKGIMKVRE